MQAFICVQCGTQYPPSEAPPERCPICEDVRQYVRWEGQAWTALDELARTHPVHWEEDHGLWGIGSKPAFAIGQRALLVRTPRANVLWDCSAPLDDATVERIKAMGGVTAIAISHCHYYTTMVEWAERLDAPILLHEANRDWVMRRHPSITWWAGESCAIAEGLTLYRCPGHFDGGTILHWAEGPDGKGALLAGDILQVTQDRRHVSVMFSYPNLIPVNAATIRSVEAIVAPLAFDRVYGAWWGRNIIGNAKDAVAASFDRYLAAIA